MLLNAGPQVLFEFNALGSVLLYKIDAGHRAIEVRFETKLLRQILRGQV